MEDLACSTDMHTEVRCATKGRDLFVDLSVGKAAFNMQPRYSCSTHSAAAAAAGSRDAWDSTEQQEPAMKVTADISIATRQLPHWLPKPHAHGQVRALLQRGSYSRGDTDAAPHIPGSVSHVLDTRHLFVRSYLQHLRSWFEIVRQTAKNSKSRVCSGHGTEFAIDLAVFAHTSSSS